MPRENGKFSFVTKETVCFEVDDFKLLATLDFTNPVLKVQSGGHYVCVDLSTFQGSGRNEAGTMKQLERSAQKCRDLIEERFRAEVGILMSMKRDTSDVRGSFLWRIAGRVAVWIGYFRTVQTHFEEKRLQAAKGIHALQVAADVCTMIKGKIGPDQALSRVLNEMREVCSKLSNTCAQLAPAFEDHLCAYDGPQNSR